MDTKTVSQTMLSVAQAKQLVWQGIEPVQSIELVDLDHALDRVLAEAVVSPINVPLQNNSAMDGYALVTEESSLGAVIQQSKFHLVGTSYAGIPFYGQLKPGDCIRITTGAVVPKDATSILIQENARIEEEFVYIRPGELCRVGEFIRLAGEDLQKDKQVFAAGRRLNSVDLGLLSSIGITQVKVFAKPRVAVLSTGDELKQAGAELSDGEIYESNRIVLLSMLKKAHCDVIDLGIIPDDKLKIRDAFLQGDQLADLVICSGGVSVGDADFTREVVQQVGQIGFWKVAAKPGKPFAFGTLPNSYFFGLPGNPVSTAVTFDLLVRIGLNKLAGQSEHSPAVVFYAELESPIKKQPGRAEFQRAIAYSDEQGLLKVRPLGNQSSGVLSSMSQANCYLCLSAEQGDMQVSERVEIQFFNQRF
ncbi:gephyrin-like molybdotransferase Glp [Rheinheimera sp. MM224]|uniref:molybdopterin molybdotransferase MoeA n=1 Tax=Rheinheimera sp. MM224 TaxID=3019969 RepID=UPI0021F839A5|nr:gephyrin-like molybdotransferase Glp [Rheinheimera sp. MM224]CAI3798361.1 Molybdopterin molybdenumtransferase [Rheinheimera sp. MM224]